MNETRALAAFAVLSNATRLRMLKSLVQAGPEGLSAGAVAGQVGAAPSRASFHLSAMTDAGLITATRHARQMVYAVDFAQIGQVMRYLMTDCCQNNATVVACCGGKPGC
tara:strand:- start:1586 stop:1912 length:327 start_codon:yes stop_codon:yes gene_type:complete